MTWRYWRYFEPFSYGPDKLGEIELTARKMDVFGCYQWLENMGIWSHYEPCTCVGIRGDFIFFYFALKIVILEDCHLLMKKFKTRVKPPKDKTVVFKSNFIQVMFWCNSFSFPVDKQLYLAFHQHPKHYMDVLYKFNLSVHWVQRKPYIFYGYIRTYYQNIAVICHRMTPNLLHN